MSLFTIHIDHVDIHVDAPPELESELHQMNLLLRRIEDKVIKIMATEAEVLKALEDANTATNEIADDLQTLIDQLAAIPAVPDSIKVSADALVSRLQGVASVVPAPTPPPVA